MLPKRTDSKAFSNLSESSFCSRKVSNSRFIYYHSEMFQNIFPNCILNKPLSNFFDFLNEIIDNLFFYILLDIQPNIFIRKV